MLIQKDQKKIRSVLENIYKPILSKEDIYYLKDEIIQLIKDFNKKTLKKNNYFGKNFIAYLLWRYCLFKSKSSIKVFQNFFQKKN